MARGEPGNFAINKTLVFNQEHCYIYRRGDTQAKYWQFYYWDSASGQGYKIRESLRTKDFNTALSRAEDRYLELRTKLKNEESLKPLSTSEMVSIFLANKQKNISRIPRRGVTQETYRVLTNRCQKLIDYLGADTRVDQLKRNAFDEYPQWRLNGCGGKQPSTHTTIKTELSTFRSIISQVAIKDRRALRYLPDFPKIVIPPSEEELRRNHFRDLELAILLRTLQSWRDEKVSRPSTSVHRKMMALAIELMLASGIRVGAVKKIRWRDVRINPKDRKGQQKIYRLITVPAENNKTGRQYECNCECGIILDLLKRISRFTKQEDFLFCNQNTGEPFSERIWSDSWNQIMQASGLHENPGRRFSFYSLRHTYATEQLRNKVPLQLLASNMNTSTTYIQRHYYNHEPEELTKELNPSKRKRTFSGEEMFMLHGRNG
jgi:integrase